VSFYPDSGFSCRFCPSLSLEKDAARTVFHRWITSEFDSDARSILVIYGILLTKRYLLSRTQIGPNFAVVATSPYQDPPKRMHYQGLKLDLTLG
jgi:hypothetical protein